MKLTVFGATGRTGVHVVQRALNAGHEVVAFVRDPAKLTIEHKTLSLVQGDVLNKADVKRAIAGADGVIGALATRGIGIGNIVSAMEELGVKRLSMAAGVGLPTEGDNPPFLYKVITFLVNLFDREGNQAIIEQMEMIRASTLDYTVARATMLTDQPGTGKVHVGSHIDKSMRPMMSREDYAQFLLDVVEDGTYLRESPVVYNFG
jgi:putative NADH-flavin reductase